MLRRDDKDLREQMRVRKERRRRRRAVKEKERERESDIRAERGALSCSEK